MQASTRLLNKTFTGSADTGGALPKASGGPSLPSERHRSPKAVLGEGDGVKWNADPPSGAGGRREDRVGTKTAEGAVSRRGKATRIALLTATEQASLYSGRS